MIPDKIVPLAESTEVIYLKHFTDLNDSKSKLVQHKEKFSLHEDLPFFLFSHENPPQKKRTSFIFF